MSARAARWRGSDFFRSMAGRIFLVLLVGMALSSMVAASLSDRSRRADIDRLYQIRTAEQVQEFVAWLNAGAIPATRPSWTRRNSVNLAHYGMAGPTDPTFTQMLVNRLGERAHVRAVRVDNGHCRRARYGPTGGPTYTRNTRLPKCWFVSGKLRQGGSFNLFVDIPARIDPRRNSPDPLLIVGIVLCAAALAFYVARSAAAPLERMAKAASELGDDLERPPTPETGPLEVQAAARAFNAMQQRIRRHLAERTQILAAITHDLQTPATRLRLRLEKVEDPELREKLISDLAAMQTLIREGLSLARSAERGEPPMWMDLDSLVQSVVEDEADAGRKVVFAGGCGCDTQGRPEALRRAISNLIDNAISYGGGAEVSIVRDGDRALVRVRDRGPGIAPDQLEAVFEPFVRLEASRSRDTGGTGLGLTIARALIEQSGGQVTLENAPGGGLVATVSLPVRETQPEPA